MQFFYTQFIAICYLNAYIIKGNNMNIVELRKQMSFEKVNQHTYRVDVPDEILLYIDNVLKNLSGDLLAHSQVLDQQLKDQLITRAVASCFITLERLKTLDKGYTVINVKAGDRNLQMSTGILQTGPTEFEVLSGVLYKE